MFTSTPRFDDENRTTRRRSRTVPLVIILIIVIAAIIKAHFYSLQFFTNKHLGQPLPVSNVFPYDYDPVSSYAYDYVSSPTYYEHTSTPAPWASPTSTPLASSTTAEPIKPSLPLNDPDYHLPVHTTNPDHAFTDGLKNTFHRPRTWMSYMSEEFKGPNVSYHSVPGKSPSPGYLFCTPATLRREKSGPLIMTDENELVWRGPPGISTNARVQQVDGKPHLTYWQTEHRLTQGHGYGAVYIMDNTYTRKYKICPKNMNIVTNREEPYDCYLDMHLLYITDRNTLLATAYNVTRWDFSRAGGPVNGYIYDAMFYEIDIHTQEILYHWRSLDHYRELPLNASKTPFQRIENGSPTHSAHGESRRTPWDYFHINSVQPYDDGGYIINSRATWQVIKIHQNGSVHWRLQGEHGGDFTLGPGVYFSWQHDARVIDSSPKQVNIMLFNNGVSGYSRRTNSSNTLMLSLDLENMHCSLIRKLVDPEETDMAMAMGNWQALPNDHVLVNYGYASVLKEFDENDEIVWRASFGRMSFRSFASSFSVFRMAWTGTPKTPPKLLSHYDDDDDETSLWMSWNGATEYDSWVVHTGKSNDSLTAAGTYDKDGFETLAVLKGFHENVQVEAKQGSKSLRKSKVTETLVGPLESDPEQDQDGWEVNDYHVPPKFAHDPDHHVNDGIDKLGSPKHNADLGDDGGGGDDDNDDDHDDDDKPDRWL